MEKEPEDKKQRPPFLCDEEWHEAAKKVGDIFRDIEESNRRRDRVQSPEEMLSGMF